ncbi:MAG: polysaccharide deacetylase family protein [Hyphomicrobiaceae bacterium]
MSRRTTGLLKAALSTLHFTGLDRLMAPMTGGVGAIFMLHRVRPAGEAGFGPNRILEVTPEFLDEAIRLVVGLGFDVISLDDVHARLAEGDFDRPFAAFTFDDGYRDNREFAYPIFRRHGLPFAIYVPTDFPDGRGDLWWLKLEMAIAASSTVELRMDGVPTRFAAATVAEKDEAFARIYWWLRAQPEDEARRIVGDLCRRAAIDASSLCRDLIMGWDELRDLASDPLVTIGAHTRRHLSLAKLTRAEARIEIEESVWRLEKELQRSVHHFSFPYGDETSAGPREFELVSELGLHTAVTTRKGLVHPHHARALTGLPRVSLNGEFQSTRYLKVMLTGAPFAFWDAAQRLKPPSAAARAGLTAYPSATAAHTSTGR